MTFSPRQMEKAAPHLTAAGRFATDAVASLPLTAIGTQIYASLVLENLTKAARELGYRLEKNGRIHHAADDDGSD